MLRVLWKRTKGMRNKLNEILAHSSWEVRSNDISVEDTVITMQQQTKRERQRKRKRDVAGEWKSEETN